MFLLKIIILPIILILLIICTNSYFNNVKIESKQSIFIRASEYGYKNDDLSKSISKLILSKLPSHIIKQIIDHYIELNVLIDIDGFLIDASLIGNFDLIKYLIKNGANIETQSLIGSTPVMFAAQKGLFDIVKYLHNHKANLRMKNNFGINVLYFAKQSKNTDLILFIKKETTFFGISY